ncbi:ATPase [Pseudomonas luteola]|uniref:McrB family protein n=1 Tax=Pseudomonas luteola TaxID=47886 RepID=UPI000F78F693|nr:AAA family ATPase [Pseudomonas luteola]RRW40037.1 ATPase [Pseudomonas luteola]
MESQKAAQSLPLNQILFGPPGTGKTYATIDAALEILDPVFLSSQRDNRVALKKRFEELMNAGRIRFITFHQSFSYEDFVEGLRAVPDESSGQLCYEVVDGVFKSFCKAVAVCNGTTAIGAFPFLIGECFGSGYKVEKTSPDLLELKKPNGKSLPLGMSLLTTLADYVRQGLLTVNDIREKRVFEKVPTSLLEPYLVNGYNNILPPLVERLLGQPGQAIAKVGEPNRNEARVFIIDEINRGNVSRIFGELITLIEPSKRTGADEALSVTLPYSKEDFSVPDTVYLIGTMNTADRSLAGLDIALRRRFTFHEMPPRPSLLDDVWVINQGVQVSIARLLERMNQRIEVLLDRDHCLGHAFFMEMKTDTSKQTLEYLSFIFRQKILPLLQEYFFEDWERIGWVLNDQNAKGDVEPFICKPSQQRSLEKLFGAEVAGKVQDRRWELNEKAFQTIDSYRNIIGNP